MSPKALLLPLAAEIELGWQICLTQSLRSPTCFVALYCVVSMKATQNPLPATLTVGSQDPEQIG
jgi:hypothetical protein